MHNRYFRKIAGLFLLGVFVFCNTPTSVLHSLFADHKDQSVLLTHADGKVSVSATGIDCFCNGNVVNAPYYYYFEAVVNPAPRCYHEYQEDLNKVYVSSFVEFFSLRAPPAFI